jgi:hypothetical protein
MNDLSRTAYLVTSIGLFAAPLIAFGVFASIQSRWSSSQSTIAAVCAAVLVFILGAATLGFSFKDVLSNFTTFIVAYAAYCFLAVSCLRIRSLFLRIPAFILAAIPICIGYVLCTIGTLALVFIIGDYTSPPRHTEQIRPDLICRITGWGAAFTASGSTVHLYKSWAWLPFLERSVASISVTESGDTETGPQIGASCADALAKYNEL